MLSPDPQDIYINANSGIVYRTLVIQVNVTGPDYQLASIPPSLTLQQNQTTQATIQATSLLGFKGLVNLSTYSYGVTGALSTPTVSLNPGETANSTLTVNAPPSIAPGRYEVYVEGQDTRGLYRSVYIPVMVTGPDFTITATPFSAELKAGQSENFTLTLSRVDEFNGTITLSASSYGPPQTTINPSTVTLNSTHVTATATITVTVPPGTEPSFYNEISIQASNGVIQNYAFIYIQIIGPDFLITPSPSLLNLKAGQTASSTLTLSSVENFTGFIGLSSVSPFPTTITPSVVNLSAGGTISANLTVTVPTTTLPGYYSVTVQAQWGTRVRTAFISIDVTGPDFYVNGFPTFLTIKPGTSATETVTLQSIDNFTGTVKLAVNYYNPLIITPNSTTVSLTPGSINSTKFQVSAPANTAPGFYNFQIVATYGPLSKTLYFQVHVIGPDFSIFSSPQSITIKQGYSGSSTIFLNSLDGFQGNLTINTNAYGLTISPSTSTISLAAGQTANRTLTISVPASTPIGFYYVSVNAVSGNIQRYTQINVQVTGRDFSLLTTPYQLTIEGGKSATSTLTLISLNGFNGTINITDYSYGANTTGTVYVRLDKPTVTLSAGGSATAVLNITTTRAAAGENINIYVTATGGNITHFAEIFVSVTGPIFSLSANPSYLSLSNGESATSTISVASIENFSGSVILTAQSYPGITASLSVQNVTLAPGSIATSTLTVTVGQVFNSGYYEVLITGTSGNQTREYALTVQVTIPDFSIDSNPQFLTIQAGKSTTSQLQLSSLNGFNGNVTLTSVLYSGNGTNPITVKIVPAIITLSSGGTATATANITTTQAASGQFYYIEVQARSGNLTRYAYIYVNVVGAAFTIRSSLQFTTVAQGSSVTAIITSSSVYNFTGTVHLSIITPSGFSATLTPQNATLTSGGSANSTLTLSVQYPTPGFYTVTIAGTSGNITRFTYINVYVISVGAFRVTATPSYHLIPAGGSAQSTVTLTGLNGFTGTITLTTNTGIVGPTATINPSSVTLNSTITVANATLTITLPKNSTSFFTTIQVIAIGNGITQIANIGVQLQPPDFTITADRTSVTVLPPGSETVKLSIVGTAGFNQTLHFFGVGSLQTGVLRYTFDVANVTITPSNPVANVTATISVARDAEPGTWEVDLWAYYNITAVPDEFSGHFAKIALTILPTPEFDLSSLPYVAYLYPGSSTTVSSNLQSTNGFSGDVNINTTSVPVGVSASPSSMVVHLSANQTASFNITITAGLTTAAGAYAFKVDATIPGVFRETQILVIVRARPDFTVSALPGSLTVPAGGKVSTSLTLTSLNFFNGTIALSTFGAPAGVSAIISPSSVQLSPFGSMSADLNFSTTVAAEPGTYTIHVIGNSTLGVHVINVTLTLTPAPDFKLSSQAQAVIIARGSQQSTLLFTSPVNGFTGPVSLTSTAPQGISTSFSVNPLTLSSPSSTLTVSVANTVATGSYKISIIGTGGSFTHSVSINITVASSPKISLSLTQTLWTHRLSLSKNNNLQTFTATIKNTGSSPAFVQMLVAGNSTSSRSFYNVETTSMIISPGQTITVTLTQQFNTSSVGQKYNVVMQLFYGTMIDQNNNILNPTMTSEAQGTFTVVK